jgi:two-component system cell cycle sensor histidine kinase/response regulator CckA
VITDSAGRTHILATTKIPFSLSTTGRNAILGVSTDITERRRTEKALQESERRYRNIFENAAEGVFQIGLDGRLIDVNPSLARMAGFDSALQMMAHVNDIGQQSYVHREDWMKIKGLLMEQGHIEGFEMQMFGKEGKTSWASVNARVAYDEIMRPAYFEGTIEDITKRKAVERALQESEEKYRSVVESSLAGFYIVQDGVFRFVNSRFTVITGHPYHETVGFLGPLDLTHPDDRTMVARNMEKCLTGAEAYVEYDSTLTRRDGKPVAVKVFGGSVNYNGRPAISGTFIDTTREKNLESQLRQAHKVEAIGQLAGGIAHDFNNILTVLSGYGSLLNLKMDREDPLRGYVSQILSATQKASSLTQSLLAFSRQRPVTLRPININTIVRGTEKLLKRLVTEDITLEIRLAPDDITIMADATQIDQILFNLATNARDAMKNGGTLTIETKSVILDKEFNQVHGFGKEGRYVLLSVTDTGAGMDEITREKIFDPFFTTKEVGRGTGLGLSTVYGVVKQHEGYIAVYSKPDLGTTFHIYLPVTTAEAEQPHPSPLPMEKGKETVLLAEDNESVREFIQEILGLHGYTVIKAVDGEDAVRKFAENSTIELIILDSVMPKKNGREAYDEIVKTRPDVKVLFISGYTRDIVLDKGVQEKEFAFISKPLSPEELLAKVRETLDR